MDYENSAARPYDPGPSPGLAPRTSYLAEIQRKLEIACKAMSELEARLGPVSAPAPPEVMRGDKTESPQNAVSEINDHLGILNDRIARVLRNLEI